MKTLLILVFLLFPGVTYAEQYLITLEVTMRTYWPTKPINTETLEITFPTTKEFFESVEEGQELTQGLHLGALDVSTSSNKTARIRKKEIK